MSKRPKIAHPAWFIWRPLRYRHQKGSSHVRDTALPSSKTSRRPIARPPRYLSPDNVKKWQVRQQYAYPPYGVERWNQCAVPIPFRPFYRPTFPLLLVCFYLLDSRGRDWCLLQTSKFILYLPWPWSLTSWSQTSTVQCLWRATCWR